MQVERWTITTREDWLKRRRANINGSEIGALFGFSPFLTPYALYADKAGLASVPSPDSDVLERGEILEPSIALAVAKERPDWKITKATDYLWSPEWRLGCTPDFNVHCPKRGRGILQGKTVAGPEYDEKWEGGIPDYVLFQTLLEGMLEDVSWMAVGVLIIRNAYKLERCVFEFERHEGSEARIKAAAKEFWTNVEIGKVPDPNWYRDDDVIKSMFPRDNGKTIDLSKDNRMPVLLDKHETFKAMKKHAENELKAVNAEIAAKMGDAAYAIVPGWKKVSLKEQTRAAHTVKESTFRVFRATREEEEARAAA